MNRIPSPWRRLARGLAICLLVCMPLSSCAAITGLVTGAFTGFVDLPSTLVTSERSQADDPDFYAASMILAPTGMVLGPFMGLFKGLVLDFSWLSGDVTYGAVYGGYTASSVWRPYAWEWIDHEGKDQGKGK